MLSLSMEPNWSLPMRGGGAKCFDEHCHCRWVCLLPAAAKVRLEVLVVVVVAVVVEMMMCMSLDLLML